MAATFRTDSVYSAGVPTFTAAGPIHSKLTAGWVDDMEASARVFGSGAIGLSHRLRELRFRLRGLSTILPAERDVAESGGLGRCGDCGSMIGGGTGTLDAGALIDAGAMLSGGGSGGKQSESCRGNGVSTIRT